uniref:Kanadaptin n=2 Tax=Cacopsylla melanoneura TaxID=428564 RepID=A0A8D8XT29_9HEMI
MEEFKTPTPIQAHNESNALDEPFQIKPAVFKKPNILIGKKGGGKIKSLLSSKDSESDIKQVPSIPSANIEKTTNLCPKESTPKSNEAPKIPTSIPYSEPSWGGIPHVKFFVEELKSGQIVNTIELSSRSFYCVGRERNTHINLLHPTVSRYHAILQFRSTFDEKDPVRGFYVYDIDSTHGTYLNRARIKPKMFVRVRVGHMLSFGSSTRFFILQGPSEDEEDESDLSVSELREQRRLELEKREREAEEAKRLEELAREAEKEAEENGGVDWGMGEDAEEESDLSENPYATTNNEELYLDDPKRTLRGWFEREGEELTYDVDDIRQGEYTCRVSLPTEGLLGRNMTAEVAVKGKKKEAVIQAALEACRMLDRHGLLRQANHEARSKRRKKHEDDDYNSDDDTFFDRTGRYVISSQGSIIVMMIRSLIEQGQSKQNVPKKQRLSPEPRAQQNPPLPKPMTP